MKRIIYDFNPYYFPIILVILFLLLEIMEHMSYKYLGSKLIKSFCYSGLGAVTFIYSVMMTQKDMVSMYAAELCFIGSIDLYFDHKAIIEQGNKKQ